MDCLDGRCRGNVDPTHANVLRLSAQALQEDIVREIAAGLDSPPHKASIVHRLAISMDVSLLDGLRMWCSRPGATVFVLYYTLQDLGLEKLANKLLNRMQSMQLHVMILGDVAQGIGASESESVAQMEIGGGASGAVGASPSTATRCQTVVIPTLCDTDLQTALRSVLGQDLSCYQIVGPSPSTKWSTKACELKGLQLTLQRCKNTTWKIGQISYGYNKSTVESMKGYPEKSTLGPQQMWSTLHPTRPAWLDETVVKTTTSICSDGGISFNIQQNDLNTGAMIEVQKPPKGVPPSPTIVSDISNMTSMTAQTPVDTDDSIDGHCPSNPLSSPTITSVEDQLSIDEHTGLKIPMQRRSLSCHFSPSPNIGSQSHNFFPKNIEHVKFRGEISPGTMEVDSALSSHFNSDQPAGMTNVISQNSGVNNNNNYHNRNLTPNHFRTFGGENAGVMSPDFGDLSLLSPNDYVPWSLGSAMLTRNTNDQDTSTSDNQVDSTLENFEIDHQVIVDGEVDGKKAQRPSELNIYNGMGIPTSKPVLMQGDFNADHQSQPKYHYYENGNVPFFYYNCPTANLMTSTTVVGSKSVPANREIQVPIQHTRQCSDPQQILNYCHTHPYSNSKSLMVHTPTEIPQSINPEQEYESNADGDYIDVLPPNSQLSSEEYTDSNITSSPVHKAMEDFQEGLKNPHSNKSDIIKGKHFRMLCNPNNTQSNLKTVPQGYHNPNFSLVSNQGQPFIPETVRYTNFPSSSSQKFIKIMPSCNGYITTTTSTPMPVPVATGMMTAVRFVQPPKAHSKPIVKQGDGNYIEPCDPPGSSTFQRIPLTTNHFPQRPPPTLTIPPPQLQPPHLPQQTQPQQTQPQQTQPQQTQPQQTQPPQSQPPQSQPPQLQPLQTQPPQSQRLQSQPLLSQLPKIQPFIPHYNVAGSVAGSDDMTRYYYIDHNAEDVAKSMVEKRNNSSASLFNTSSLHHRRMSDTTRMSLEEQLSMVEGWCADETDQTIEKNMEKFRSRDGYFIVWRSREKNRFMITVSYHCELHHFQVGEEKQASNSERLLYFIYRHGGFKSESFLELVNHYIYSGIKKPLLSKDEGQGAKVYDFITIHPKHPLKVKVERKRKSQPK